MNLLDLEHSGIRVSSYWAKALPKKELERKLHEAVRLARTRLEAPELTMPKRKKAPELTFQQHIADFLVREHKYGVLEQTDITDTRALHRRRSPLGLPQSHAGRPAQETADDYGTDAREEVFKALRKELEHTPLWMLMRHGLKVRGLEFRLFYPKPRSAASAAATKYGENRITFRPHFYFGAPFLEKHWEIDFVLFLNGLPIVALELKHEDNQNVHDAVAQFAKRDHARKFSSIRFCTSPPIPAT